MGITRSLLRYHGGKWKLAPWIISYFPSHKVYTEAFGGAASVLLRKPRSWAEVYNDLDGEVVNLFRVLRNPTQARELIRLIKLTPFAREEFESSYLVADDPIEQARRTLIKAGMGYGSDSVQNKHGFRIYTGDNRAKTPATDWTTTALTLEAIAERFSGVIVENRPAMSVIEENDAPDVLHYVDPPYPASTRTAGVWYRHEMNIEDHKALAHLLHQVEGKVIISGYSCDLYDNELYVDWQRVTKATHADGGAARTEVLWISPNAVVRPQLFSVGS